MRKQLQRNWKRLNNTDVFAKICVTHILWLAQCQPVFLTDPQRFRLGTSGVKFNFLLRPEDKGIPESLHTDSEDSLASRRAELVDVNLLRIKINAVTPLRMCSAQRCDGGEVGATLVQQLKATRCAMNSCKCTKITAWQDNELSRDWQAEYLGWLQSNKHRGM